MNFIFEIGIIYNLSGIDMEPSKEGGTWLALSLKGKAGVVLNLTNEHGLSGTQKKGRGPLVADFVTSDYSATSYLDELHGENLNGQPYNPFTLVLFNLRYVNNCQNLSDQSILRLRYKIS